MTHERIRTTFDGWVGNGWADELQDEHGDVVRQVIAAMDIRAGEQTLDLGCGTGWATRVLAAAAPGASAVGVDVAPQMISRAEALHDLTSRARYETGTFEELDFPDGKFHRVFSMEALYYAVDLRRAIAEAFRVLKSGGPADVVVDVYRESVHTEKWLEVLGLDIHFLSEAEWRAAFEDAGFTNVALQRVIDSRGPGDESAFTPDVHYTDWQMRTEQIAAGSLWIHAEKPA